MAGRKLTDAEKKKIHDYALRVERARNPDANVSVVVGDELSDDGKVHWNAIIQRTEILPGR